MLLSKQQLCGHTVFYELSHQTGCLLEGRGFSRRQRARGAEREPASSAEGQAHSPKVMRSGASLWSLMC